MKILLIDILFFVSVILLILQGNLGGAVYLSLGYIIFNGIGKYFLIRAMDKRIKNIEVRKYFGLKI